MKVILNADLPNLGEEGDICDVADGYARNYLLPRKLVLKYNNQNVALLEGRRESIEKRREDKRKEAMTVKERLEGEPLVISMPAGENGRLFGSVTSATVAENLEKAGIDIERKQVDIPSKTIKSVGTTKIRVRLYDNQEAELLVEVKPSGVEKKTEEPEEKPVEKEPQPQPQNQQQDDYDDFDDFDEYDDDEYDDEDYEE